jgi:hypothetical protein
MLSIRLSLLFPYLFSPQLGFLGSEQSSSVKPHNIDLDDLPVQERNCMTAANLAL